MSDKHAFIEEMVEGYRSKSETMTLGAGMLGGECFKEVAVTVPLKMLNRHGLIAGATGTGKTKTLQVMAGELSEAGVPVLLMDIKGDLSGLGKEGDERDFILERHQKIGIPFKPSAYPVEFLSLSDEKGVRLKATVSEFGPILMAKILGLNETQAGVLAVLYQYCDDRSLPLLDLKDLKKVLQYISEEGNDDIEKLYGHISSTTVGTILRRILEVEQQGGERFFGEKSFEVNDLVRFNEKGLGIISIMRLSDIQNRPKLFSTFMLSLLAEIYASFPEVGDRDKPKLVIFFDEAHLIFDEASKALLEQFETIIKLIRSKGVGIIFCTQSPADIPDHILGQLGFKVQHALRAFTAKDRKAIKLAAQNFPITTFYRTDEMLTHLGIGEALITALNDKGIPTPLVHTLLKAPRSHMGLLDDVEIDQQIASSELVQKYNREIDSKSAYEMLNEKIFQEKKTWSLDDILDSSIAKEVSRTIAKEISRAILGVLGLGGKRGIK